ncbi:hypothetical protein BC940DRAFT_268210 [Gongronella butleri]|nr:hypothetical protein BC940DRAFT_268210 [Gongronella butleri]
MEEAEDDAKVAGAKRERDSDAESSDAAEDDEEEEEEAPAPKKSKVTISREQPQQFGAEGLSLFIGQLDFSANDQDLKTFLEKQGIEVKNVRMSKHRHIEGNNRGFAHVDVEDEENKNKVLALNGKEFMDRKLRIDDGTAATQRKTDTNFSSKSKTVFVANLSRDIDEDGFKEAFESFGTIVSVRLPIDRETNNIKGFGYVEFESEDIAEKAVKEMSGVRINNRPIRTDFAGSVDGDRATHRGDRGRGGFRGGRGGGRGDFRGGRGGGRGRGGFGGDRGRGGFRGGRGRGGY